LADFTLLGKPWGATLIGKELCIAFSTDSTLGCEPAVTIVDKVGQDLSVTIFDSRPDRHMDK
jgi:hypothetical protein